MSGGSPGYQPIWVPVENTTDCSQGFCSRYCPQWCYVTFPPPPPFDVQDSGSTFSPLVIGIIGILASAFIIVSYYTVVAKCCGNRHSTRRRSQATTTDGEDLERNHNAVETWLVPPNSGLDQSTIDSIAVRKYRKGDGLIVSGDCSVCLGEFEEDDRLRLLPKCSHAFHLSCIDRWLQAHSNCPLCRASVLVVSTPTPVSLPQLPSPAPGILIPVTLQSETRAPGQAQEVEEGRHSVVVAEEYGVISSIHGVQEREVIRLVGPNNGGRSQSDLGRKEEAIIEIGDEEIRFLRRSISMDWSSGNSISMAAGMCMNREVAADGLESSSASVCRDQTKNRGEFSRNNKNQNGVRAPPSMLRTSSSERFLLVRGRSAVLLL